MKKLEQLVSVIISTYNNRKTIEKCLSSIKKQTYRNIETLVVDEYSTDGTLGIAKLFKTRFYSHGPERANNRNYGMQKAKGEYYFIVDSDMELTKNVISDCIIQCQKNKADAVVIPEKSIGKGYWSQVRALEKSFYADGDVSDAARFFKKNVIKTIGGYDPLIVGAEDWDLHQRVSMHNYTIKRIKSFIIHNEENITLGRLLKKKIYYGKAFLLFKNRYPKAFGNSIVRQSLLKNLPTLILHPFYGFGVIFLKFLEGISLFYGMILASLGRQYMHY